MPDVGLHLPHRSPGEGRGEGAPTPCALHPGIASVVGCAECLAPLCADCLRFVDGRDLCPGCARRQVKRRWIKRGIMAAASVLLVGGAVALLTSGRGPLRYGAHTGRVQELQARLARNPCDGAAAVELGDALLQAGTVAEVEPMADAFAARCGRQEELLWKVYGALTHSGQWERALAVATDLIEHRPGDKDYWWWRGVVHEHLGHLDEAVADYRRTLAIRPDIDAIPFNLADVLERQQRPCDAALAIEQFLAFHPMFRKDDTIRLRLSRLQREGHCGEAVGGKVIVRFPPGSSAIVTQATVNGQRGRFLIDTGATFVAVSEAFAERARVSAAPSAAIPVATANGTVTARLTRLESVSLQGLTATGVDGAVVSGLPGDIDGLVGLSFLSRFDMHLDAAAGMMELSARER